MSICIFITKYHFMYFVFVFHNYKFCSLSTNNTSHSGWSVICRGRPAASSARLTSGQAAYGCVANRTWCRHSRSTKIGIHIVVGTPHLGTSVQMRCWSRATNSTGYPATTGATNSLVQISNWIQNKYPANTGEPISQNQCRETIIPEHISG